MIPRNHDEAVRTLRDLPPAEFATLVLRYLLDERLHGIDAGETVRAVWKEVGPKDPARERPDPMRAIYDELRAREEADGPDSRDYQQLLMQLRDLQRAEAAELEATLRLHRPLPPGAGDTALRLADEAIARHEDTPPADPTTETSH